MRVTRNYMNALTGANNNSPTSLLQRALGRSSKGKKASRSTLLNSLNNRNALLTQNITNAVQNQRLYYNMKYHAGQVMEYADKLTDKGEESLFAKAKESGDISEIVSSIKGFVSHYNDMLKNLQDSGTRTDNSYLTQLNSIARTNGSALASCGVTRKSDGTLVVDEEKLASTELDTLETVWNSNSSFASRTALWSDSIESAAERNLAAKASSSYSSLFNNYGSSGNYFNFFR